MDLELETFLIALYVMGDEVSQSHLRPQMPTRGWPRATSRRAGRPSYSSGRGRGGRRCQARWPPRPTSPRCSPQRLDGARAQLGGGLDQAGHARQRLSRRRVAAALGPGLRRASVLAAQAGGKGRATEGQGHFQ
jgi:hypothetical protein